jgi:integrase/recombinase XerD
MRKAESGTRCPAIPAWKCILMTGSERLEYSEKRKKPLFRSVHKGDNLTGNAMSRFDIFQMIKRRAKQAGLPYSTCCHTFRATGITTYLLNGGTLEHAQTIANHESPRTTKRYDRTGEELSLDEMEKIKI